MVDLAPGCATAAGTARFRERMQDRSGAGHFRRLGDLWLSSIGLGTYLGETDRRDDDLYIRAALRALAGGVAANGALRRAVIAKSSTPVRVPPPRLCTDNAAMIGAAGFYRFQAGMTAGLDFDVIPTMRLA